MNSFFRYTLAVNNGSKVDNAALTHYNIGIDDDIWKDDGAWIDDDSWRNIGCWMDKCGKLSTILFYPIYPLHPEPIVAKSGDERGVFINIGWNG